MWKNLLKLVKNCKKKQKKSGILLFENILNSQQNLYVQMDTKRDFGLFVTWKSIFNESYTTIMQLWYSLKLKTIWSWTLSIHYICKVIFYVGSM